MKATIYFTTLFIVILGILLSISFSQEMNTQIIEKVNRFQSLLREKIEKGFDVSEAIELDQKSREAVEKGDMVIADKLLGDAINVLSGLSEVKKATSRVVRLRIKEDRARITEGVPKYEMGKDVGKYNLAFDTKTVKAKDGIIELKIGSIPVFVEEGEPIREPKSKIVDSPFGSHPAHTYITSFDRTPFTPPSKIGYDYNSAQDIGIKWNRPELYALWDLIQKTDDDIEKGIFYWQDTDYVYGTLPKGMHTFANIDGIGLGDRAVKGKEPFPKTFSFKSKYLEEKYIHFVRKVVERYDGDGIDDMPGLANPVKFWQVCNEPDLGSNDVEGYAHLMEITYKAIKQSCPDCKVAMGGLAAGKIGFEKFYIPVLKKLGGKYVDIFDFHHFGPVGGWRPFKNLYDIIKKGLSENGYDKTEIWVTETGTYTGKPKITPSGPKQVNIKTGYLPEQTEKKQAADLIKRYISALSTGVKKVFWAFGLVEGFTKDSEGGEFDHTGLIYDGSGRNDLGRDVKKLSYYAYKKMTEMLEGSNFSEIETMDLGKGIYSYKFIRSGKLIYVLWVE
jgi:hypothetical protein